MDQSTPPASPLRDGVLSNSPFTITSPLRISAKSPATNIPRRTSSSFKHVRNNNLVSKSPFKTQIPMPNSSPAMAFPMRRVSGEKRSRPVSLQDEGEIENDRPLFGMKRERKQSKGFVALGAAEPVSKSPFKAPGGISTPKPAVPSTSALSPQRSSLVSRRMHGPRISGGRAREKRLRRKTVTFDERCDVLEFERDESSVEISVDPLESDSDTDSVTYQDPPENPQYDLENLDSSYDSVDINLDGHIDGHMDDDDNYSDSGLDLDPDQSISGLVDSMFAVQQPSSSDTPPATPPHRHNLPPDSEAENGVPLGREHAIRHMSHVQIFEQLPIQAASPQTPNSDQHHNTPPLGRSTHLERTLARDQADDDVERAIDMLPGSPTPAKAHSLPHSTIDALVPKFDLGLETSAAVSHGDDPFGDGSQGPSLQADPANLSIGASEVSLNGLLGTREVSESGNEEPQSDIKSLPTPEDDTSISSMLSDVPLETTVEKELGSNASPFASPPRSSSNSPLSTADLQPRKRISRESIHRRLLRTVNNLGDESIIAEAANQVSLEVEVVQFDFENSPVHQRQETGSSRTESDISAETAEIRTAVNLPISTSKPALTVDEFGSGLSFDFGSKFGRGLGIEGMGTRGRALSNSSASTSRSRDGPTKVGVADEKGAMRMSVSMGDLDVDMDMRSALDRLLDDVGSAASVDNTEPKPSSDLNTDGFNGFLSRNASSSSGPPPPVPPKDNNIKNRQQMILEKRREARMREDGIFEDAPLPGRVSKRRSMSTGQIGGTRGTRGAMLRGSPELEMPVSDVELADSIEKELRKLENPTDRKSKYLVRERGGTIYASSDVDRISHMNSVGDVNGGKAWRTVRRPSDMNEYSKQIKEFRSQEKPGKAHGKVFVKVLGIKGLNVPLPQQPTVVTCTLNNGIHFVTTPECKLGLDSRVEQEFELIEHSKLEFTLTMKVRRDPHIVAEFKALTPAPVAAPAPPVIAPIPLAQTSSRGMRSFFSSSPKKSHKEKIVPKTVPVPVSPRVVPLVQQPLPENLARYLKPDGSLARAFIAFKDVAHRCDSRLFETNYPLIGQKIELGGKFSTMQVGEVVLQMFRLPPLPGLSPEQLPQSLEECHRGLRHINWHKVTYFEGTLTQSGGDCSQWRRRQLRVIGANLVAFNDVTKKATATIDLKKALAVEDDQEARTPSSNVSGRPSRYADEYDGLYGVERSFRLIFPHEQEIIFFADTDDEKARWLEVLRALVGHIPPNPLWAELLWQRQEELAKRAAPAASATPSRHSRPPSRTPQI